ncbi:MAG: radical SAM protein [Candidatus Adiutrix sp.]|nr:radical SAM protein [Candidatus Adiutrix sp.]
MNPVTGDPAGAPGKIRAGSYERVRDLHPCFGARFNRGRMHLPVCSRCNIKCRFCDRKLSDREDRPGVASSIISPADALGYVERALEICPEISVIGIAGPGDALADNAALETFQAIGRKYPDLLKCMSTNGLMLAERSGEVIEAGVDTLTVTVNGVAPEITARIVGGLVFHGQYYQGLEAAEILIENQLAGLARVAAAGIQVKVNTVLISEINAAHIGDIARAVARAGARLHNIIPLIPQHEFRHLSEPGCRELALAREEVSKYLEPFRHCRRCRADAVGIPGRCDFSRKVYAEGFAARETFSHG